MPEDDPADLDRELLENLDFSQLRQKGNVCSQPQEYPPLCDHQITPQIFNESVFCPAAGLAHVLLPDWLYTHIAQDYAFRWEDRKMHLLKDFNLA